MQQRIAVHFIDPERFRWQARMRVNAEFSPSAARPHHFLPASISFPTWAQPAPERQLVRTLDWTAETRRRPDWRVMGDQDQGSENLDR
jgi:hypothetical protein